MAGTENKITLSVDVKNSVNDLQKIFGRMNNESTFTGKNGGKDRSVATGHMTTIQNLLDKDSLSIEEFKTLKRSFNAVTSILNKYASQMSGLSEEANKLQLEFKKAQKQYEEANSKLENEKTRNAESSEKVKSILRKNNLSVHTRNKDGSISARELTNPKAMQGRVDDLVFVKPNGKEFKGEATIGNIKASLGDYAQSAENIANLTVEVKKLSEAAEDASQKVADQVAKDTASGNNETAQIVPALNSASTSFNEAANKQIQEVKDAETSAAKEFEATNLTLKTQKSALGKAIKSFTIYATAVRVAKAALREAVATITELDKSLTEQAMVTGMSRDQAYSLLSTYQQMSQKLGATTKEVAEAASEYLKQGKTVAETLILTEAAISSAKVAGISVSDSINYLTTALNGFKLSASEAMEVSDRFAAVAASSATGYDELAIALSKVASQANLAGMSIDYTTALLATGLETTREAPETMGTALKTIVARMRELDDYGETLQGDTDVNNVESQLNYIGIKLRDTSGELRSTEDVLDELGQKWETLNKNQQAAVAKALAGTRQQSRLIAMMDNYDRVLELQKTAERSSGATTAQMSKYLQGMEAALNNVKVAWEKVVTTFTNSDGIIWIVNFVADAIENLNKFFQTPFGKTTLIVSIGQALTGIIAKLYLERQVRTNTLKAQRLQNELTLKQNIAQETINQRQLQGLILATKTFIVNRKDLLQKQNYTAEQIANDAEILEAQGELKTYQEQYASSLATQKAEQSQLNEVQAENNSLLGVSYRLIALQATWQSVLNTFHKASLVIKKIWTALTNKETAATAANTTATNINTTAKVASKIATLDLVGVTIALAAALVAAIGCLCWFCKEQGKQAKSAEQAAENVNKLSSEIYELNKKANELDEIIDKFDDLDNKIIKTKSDLEEMSSLLDSAADSLSDDVGENEDIGYGKGVSEKDYYESLSTDRERKNFLESREQAAREEANKARQKQLDYINNLSDKQKNVFANSSDSTIVSARDAVYAINNSRLYDSIDGMISLTDEERDAMEELGQQILENVDFNEALRIANNGLDKSLLSTLSLIKVVAKNADGIQEDTSAALVLTSDDYSIKEKVYAYRQIGEALKGDLKALDAFQTQYAEYKVFTQMTDDVLDFIESANLSNDEINDLWLVIQKFGGSTKQFQQFLQALSQTSGDIAQAISATFSNLDEDSIKKLFNTYADAVEVGALNMGQNLDALSNKINNFYEKASEWSTMSKSDQMEFISDNADLFSGESGESLLNAFNNGDYDIIQAALASNEALEELRLRRLKEIRQELLVEQEKTGDDYNAAYVAQLKKLKAQLENVDSLYQASLETRLEQEKSALDEYKSYLEEQQTALEDSLNKRKDAYEKYFDAINQEEDDEDYEEQAQLLVSNLSKLGSTTNASANSQRAELENQLEELEQEHLEDLRERAQEAVVQNIEDELDEISDKFDELLESNKMLLAAMTGELENSPSSLFANMISAEATNGATGLELESYIQDLQTTYGYTLGSADLSGIEVTQSGSSLYLNVNGQSYELNTSDQQSLYKTIMAALQQLGIR